MVDDNDNDEDALTPVANNVSAGSVTARLPTPVKRTTTPVKGMRNTHSIVNIPRSSSTPKKRLFIKALNEQQPEQILRSNKLLTTKFGIAGTTRAQSAGRRKIQKWENDNLIGLHRYIGRNIRTDSLTEDDLEILGDAYINPNLNGIKIDFKSNFRELLQPENRILMEQYLKCQNAGKINPPKNSNTGDSDNDIALLTNKCWNRIQNRLKITTIHSLRSNANLSLFVQELERILLYYIEYQKIPQVIHDCILHRLDKPIAISCPLTKMKNTNSTDSADMVLTISLKDSSFHRLLLHATCQFYGLISKSISTQSKYRSTIISLPINHASSLLLCTEKVSMVKYLQTHSQVQQRCDEDDILVEDLNSFRI